MHLPNGPLAMPHSPEHESFSVYATFKYYCLKSCVFEDIDRRFHTDHSISPRFFLPGHLESKPFQIKLQAELAPWASVNHAQGVEVLQGT